MGKATAREKLRRESPSHGKAVIVPPSMKQWAGKKMLIPKPIDVDAQMREARKGSVITLSTLRDRLALDAKVDLCCPLTTGIFARLAAEAAEEDRAEGKTRVTPWWRTVRDDGALIEKFPGGVARQAQLLRDEGVELGTVGRSSKLRVLTVALAGNVRKTRVVFASMTWHAILRPQRALSGPHPVCGRSGRVFDFA